MKKVLRTAVLTIICAGILSAASLPKNIKAVAPGVSPMPTCSPGMDCWPGSTK